MQQLRAALSQNDQVECEILDPDLFEGIYSGTRVRVERADYLYHSLRSWSDLAQLLGCRLLTPKKVDTQHIHLTLRKLPEESFHTQKETDPKEKYGKNSTFWQINKLEEPTFVHYFVQALENVSLPKRRRILDLGIHRGDEYGLIVQLYGQKGLRLPEFVGIDHSQSAIDDAVQKYGSDTTYFIAADINALDTLKLGRFDLIISIGTLQSPGIAYKPLLMDLVQNYLHKEESALILGFPNCRWRGGEMIYGAKAPNYAMSEMSLLFGDVIFAKKYLQQHKYRVTITGREYIFVTATKIQVRKTS